MMKNHGKRNKRVRDGQITVLGVFEILDSGSRKESVLEALKDYVAEVSQEVLSLFEQN